MPALEHICGEGEMEKVVAASKISKLKNKDRLTERLKIPFQGR